MLFRVVSAVKWSTNKDAMQIKDESVEYFLFHNQPEKSDLNGKDGSAFSIMVKALRRSLIYSEVLFDSIFLTFKSDMSQSYPIFSG